MRVIVPDSGWLERWRPARTTPRGEATHNAASFSRYLFGNAGALLLGLIVAYLTLAATGVGDAATKSIKATDFMTYYSVFQLVLHGHIGAIYDPHVLSHVEAALSRPLRVPYGINPYLYPPSFAIIFAPFGALPYGAAYLIWLAMNCVLLAISLYELERCAGLGRRSSLVFRGLALCFLPTFLALGLGQSTLIVLACLTVAFVALRTEHEVLAGLCLASVVFKPYYVLPMLVVVAVQRRWQVVAAFLGGCVALVLVVVPISGLGAWRSYLQILLVTAQWQGHAGHITFDGLVVATAVYAPVWNHSLAGFADLLFSTHVAFVVSVAGSLVTLGVVAWLARNRHRTDLALAVAVTAGLFISPHTLAYDLTVLLLPGAVVLHYRYLAPRTAYLVLALGYALVVIGYRLVFITSVQLSALVMIILIAWLVWAAALELAKVRGPDAGITSDLSPEAGMA